MGTQHQPRRDDAQRVIDRQTRARRELMRRQNLDYIQANIAAMRKLAAEPTGILPIPPRPSRLARTVGAVRRFLADAADGFHDVIVDLIEGFREAFK